MRLLTFAVLGSVLACTAMSAEAEDLTEIQTPVYTAEGTKAQILERGRRCIEKHVRFDEVIRSIQPPTPVGAQTAVRRLNFDGGPVVTAQTADAVLANVRGRVSVWGDSRSIQARMTLEAKDGRFRIRYHDIEAMNLSRLSQESKYNPPDADSKLARGAALVLKKVTEKVAECVRRESPEGW